MSGPARVLAGGRAGDSIYTYRAEAKKMLRGLLAGFDAAAAGALC